ncbi:Protein trichome birefringence-like 10 [Zea mays]|uniref:RING-type E3 ubiquitin transferase n=1 Tax=Zea mays TaxID=4577 RepID=A0A1D6ILD4_MAIZE|nr:Protein trichome birefringence-like 10 [Zea mays]
MMIPWGGVGCCLSAAALYLLGRSSGSDAEVLRSVARAGSMKDLAAILDTASKVLPLVVAISGRVGSDTPLICQQSGMRGVIVEETAEQHFLKHNDAGSWIQDSAVMLSVSKEVPWYLDDGTGRVYVVGARSAAGLILTVASEVFEESGRTLVRGTLDYLQGLKMLGVKRTERVLPTGTSLTVVGEVLFLLSIALKILILFYSYRVLNAAAQRQAREAEGSKGTSDAEPNSKKDQLVLDICVICLEQEYNAVFVP